MRAASLGSDTRVALRNLLRQKTRTAITLTAIAIGVAAIIVTGGFVQDIFVQLGEALIHSRSGHLQIASKGYFASGSRSPNEFLISDPAPVLREVAAAPGVRDAFARIGFTGLAVNGRADLSILGEGIEADREAAFGTALNIVAGRQLTDRDDFGAVIGAGVAEALQLGPGDRMVLLVSTAQGALNSLDFEVVGVFRTLSKDFDDHAVRMGIGAARELVDSRGASVIVVGLQQTSDTQVVASALSTKLNGAGYEIRTWEELNDFYRKAVTLYDRQFGVLQLIVLVMVVLSVANSVNMSLFERIAEFGTVRALGRRSRDVFRMVMLESALLACAGAAVGVGVGIALAQLVSLVGIPMPPPPNANVGYTARILVIPEVVAMALFVGIGATLAASFLPGFRLARMPVADALRRSV
jgi:putative ABC transport system permease protein